MEGDDFEAFVKEHGARIVHAVSSKKIYIFKIKILLLICVIYRESQLCGSG